MLSTISLIFLIYITTIGVIVMVYSEIQGQKAYEKNFNKSSAQIVEESLRQADQNRFTLIDPSKTCLEGIIGISSLARAIATPFYAYWAYTNNVGHPLISIACILVIFSLWIYLFGIFGKILPPLISAVPRVINFGGSLADDESIKAKITGEMKDHRQFYSWRSVLTRVYSKLPVIYLVYLLIVIVKPS